MANILTLLKLEELSLVDNPANPLAMAPLYKRHSEGETMADKEETQELPVEITNKLEKFDRLESENQVLRKALTDNGFTIRKDGVEKHAEPEYIEVEGVQVNKAEVPAPVLKALELAQVEKQKMRLEKRCEEVLPNVKKEHAEALLTKFDEDDQEILEFFKSVDQLFAESMKEVGKKEVDADMTSADEKLDQMVKAYMKESNMQKKDYAKAYASVVKSDEGKELLKQVYKGDS